MKLNLNNNKLGYSLINIVSHSLLCEIKFKNFIFFTMISFPSTWCIIPRGRWCGQGCSNWIQQYSGCGDLKTVFSKPVAQIGSLLKVISSVRPHIKKYKIFLNKMHIVRLQWKYEKFKFGKDQVKYLQDDQYQF